MYHVHSYSVITVDIYCWFGRSDVAKLFCACLQLFYCCCCYTDDNDKL